jgi:hypothetical protein
VAHFGAGESSTLESTIHTTLGDKVRLYKRPNSPYWQCSTFLNGKKRRTSSKTDSLAQAKDYAEDWYLTLRGKHRRGELHNEKSFEVAAKRFMHEYEVLTEGERNKRWVEDHYRRIRMHLNPFFGQLALSSITAGVVQDYRISRLKPESPKKKIPSRSTLHHETVTLRQVLRTAVRHGWLSHVPDMVVSRKWWKLISRASGRVEFCADQAAWSSVASATG